MGVLGLTSFVNLRSNIYLESFDLHDMYLVIDGNCVLYQLYSRYSYCNCAFGGDYDTYYQSVVDFIDDLLMCNVTPLVIFDGATDERKFKTVMNRIIQKIKTASTFCPIDQSRMKFNPMQLTRIFINVLKEKQIRHVQCLSEADNHIASVAKLLNCPVLSADSDFYIYGSLYIPFDTLSNSISKMFNGKSYTKHCKIYRIQNFLDSFRGLHLPMMPLAAVLLGNDLIKREVFKNFYRHLALPGISSRRPNQQQCYIEAVFKWLSRYTLDEAITKILSSVKKFERQKILNIIEININSYLNVSVEVLILLGFSQNEIAKLKIHHVHKVFKFHADINNLGESCEQDSNDSDEKEEVEDVIITDKFNVLELSNEALVNKLPRWFVKEYHEAELPSYFMNMLTNHLYICPVQIEDYKYPPSIMMSMEIISVIFRLLQSKKVNKRRNNVEYLMCMIRGQNKRLVCYKLRCAQDLSSYQLPFISDLRMISLTIRRKIFNDTLNVNTQCVNEFPPEWRLYIICIMYWIQHQEPYILCKSSIYAILVCMLFNIIDSKIGKYRYLAKFQQKYGERMKCIEEKRKADDYKPHYLMDITITDAINEVDFDDCLLVASFFISNFKADMKIFINSKRFDRSIVHTFAQFQNCLLHSIDLNTLLGKPYLAIKVANLYNGTLLYNLCNNFRTRSNVVEYISTLFQKAPSFLRLFNIIVLKLKTLVPLLANDATDIRKKRKVKNKHLKTVEKSSDTDSEYLTTEEDVDESKFYDKNNYFSILNNI